MTAFRVVEVRDPCGGLQSGLGAGGEVREDWCPACKAYTRITGSLALLTPAGVSTIGTWAWCSVCEDPDDQEASRG